MKTLVANYGYIETGEDVTSWGADAVVDAPVDILKHL
jgi:hypothetical protein